MDINILILGAGVQSSAMALMSAYGDLPRSDYIIFSVTGNEPKVVYDWLDELEEVLNDHEIKIIRIYNKNIFKYPLFEKGLGLDRLDAINYVMDKMGKLPPQYLQL